MFRSNTAQIGLALLGALYAGRPSQAQTSQWAAPASGYVFDSEHNTIRPITGLIGSAWLGSPVLDGIDWASIAPNQRYALVQRGVSLVWVPDLSVSDQSQVLEQIPLPERILWASDSSRAVALSRSRLSWLSGFGSSPAEEVGWPLENLARPVTRAGVRCGPYRNEADAALRACVPTPAALTVWSVLAVDAQADKVLLVSRSSDTSQLWLASRTAPPRPIPFNGIPAAGAFSSAGSGVLLIDTASHQILRMQNLDGAPTFTQLLSSDVYTEDPAGIVFSPDDRHLFVADKTAAVIREFDTATGDFVSGLPLDVAPLSLSVFSPGRFQVHGEAANEPFLFLDTVEPARISFVPRQN